MSDKLREALERIVSLEEQQPGLKALVSEMRATARAALSAPQAEAEAVAYRWRTRRHDNSNPWQIVDKFSPALMEKSIEFEPLYTAPPSQSAEMREALVLAEDVLSRAPFSTGIWPNGMHPQRGIEIIRKALSRAGDGKESEGGTEGRALKRAGWPEASNSKDGGPSQAGIKPGPSEPKPAPVAEAPHNSGERDPSVMPGFAGAGGREAIARMLAEKWPGDYMQGDDESEREPNALAYETADAAILALLRGGE